MGKKTKAPAHVIFDTKDQKYFVIQGSARYSARNMTEAGELTRKLNKQPSRFAVDLDTLVPDVSW